MKQSILSLWLLMMTIGIPNTVTAAEVWLYYFWGIKGPEISVKKISGELIDHDEYGYLAISTKKGPRIIKLDQVLLLRFNFSDCFEGAGKQSRRSFYEQESWYFRKDSLSENPKVIMNDGLYIEGKLVNVTSFAGTVQTQAEKLTVNWSNTCLFSKNVMITSSDNQAYNPYGAKRFIITQIEHGKIHFQYVESQPMMHMQAPYIVVKE